MGAYTGMELQDLRRTIIESIEAFIGQIAVMIETQRRRKGGAGSMSWSRQATMSGAVSRPSAPVSASGISGGAR